MRNFSVKGRQKACLVGRDTVTRNRVVLWDTGLMERHTFDQWLVDSVAWYQYDP